MTRFPPTPVDETGKATEATMIDMIVAATAFSRAFDVPVEQLLSDWAPSHIDVARSLAAAAGKDLS